MVPHQRDRPGCLGPQIETLSRKRPNTDHVSHMTDRINLILPYLVQSDLEGRKIPMNIGENSDPQDTTQQTCIIA